MSRATNLVLSILLVGCGADDPDPVRSSASALSVPLYAKDATDFFVLADGTDLKAIDTNNLLKRRTGAGKSFSAQSSYASLKKDSKVHWVVRDLESGALLGASANAHQNVYGASVSKALVAAALLDKRQGKLAASEWRLVFRLLVESDNGVWSTLENLAGGKSAVDAFTQAMGYKKTQGSRSGNQLNARELGDFLVDVHQQRFAGAEGLLKVMSACATGAAKAVKYVPSEVLLGGKTGTWNEYQHDMRFVETGGKRTAIVVLTRRGKDEDVAVTFGGLLREHLGSEPPPAGFVGQPCAADAGCESGRCLTSFPGELLFEGGMCTQSCTKLCPDRNGQPETFCLSFDASQGSFGGAAGHCFSRCDTKAYPGDGCRAGYACVKLQRHKDASVKRNVCVPEGKTDLPLAEPADGEGDLPEPERLEEAGCSLAGSVAPASTAPLLLLAAVAWRRCRRRSALGSSHHGVDEPRRGGAGTTRS